MDDTFSYMFWFIQLPPLEAPGPPLRSNLVEPPIIRVSPSALKPPYLASSIWHKIKHVAKVTNTNITATPTASVDAFSAR